MLKRGRICLIDDDVALCQAIALGLRDAGFEVIDVPGAIAGLDVVRRGTRGAIDAIVTDLNMPGTSGAQLIEEVRREWPSMPVVAISGSPVDGHDIAEAARMVGADSILLKPFRAKQLAELLEQLLTHRTESM